MKKVLCFLSSVISIFALVFIFLFGINKYYDKKLDAKYFDKIGDNYADTVKDSGMALQEESVKRTDNVLVYGSSELGSLIKPFHPAYFFENKKTGFQINIIGRGYSQSLVHGLNFGALGKDLANKKVVFLLSPQWFEAGGLASSSFVMNFSSLQFYAFAFNHDISKDIKVQTANRVKSLISESKDSEDIKLYCSLLSKNNFIGNAELTILKPYFYAKYYYLQIKDKKASCDELKNNGKNITKIKRGNQKINWQDELEKATEEGKEQSNNNNIKFENTYYSLYIKDKLTSLKGCLKGYSYLESPEYNDLNLLLQICKQEKIKPLFVNVPVNGYWYDYAQFPKTDRQQYYKKVNSMVKSYGFEMADFSNMEYEDYFLKDSMHLGWKGWVYVDEAIDKYYHEKR